MSDSNHVSMNIPDTNPLFDWIMNRDHFGPIPYVNVSVGDVSARLQLIETPVIHQNRSSFCDDDIKTRRSEMYLETSWILRDDA